jgi:hypothetical protein
VKFPSGREKLIFVVDIGGGTSDFSVVRISSDNAGFDVLGSAGLYVGGNDFDHKLSFFELSRLFGNWETLELNGLVAPSAPYSTLSDWKSLNKLYTRDTQKQIRWMTINSPNSKGLKAFDHLVRNHEAHTYAKRTEQIKIGLSGADQQTFVYETPDAHLERLVARQTFEDLIDEAVSRMDAVANECLTRAGVTPDQITDVVMVGGSTMPQCQRTTASAPWQKDWRHMGRQSAEGNWRSSRQEEGGLLLSGQFGGGLGEVDIAGGQRDDVFIFAPEEGPVLAVFREVRLQDQDTGYDAAGNEGEIRPVIAIGDQFGFRANARHQREIMPRMATENVVKRVKHFLFRDQVRIGAADGIGNICLPDN